MAHRRSLCLASTGIAPRTVAKALACRALVPLRLWPAVPAVVGLGRPYRQCWGRLAQLDERASRPLVFAKDLCELDASRAGRLVIPAHLRPAEVPPPEEGVIALDNAFQRGHSVSDAGADAAWKSQVGCCNVQRRKQDFTVL